MKLNFRGQVLMRLGVLLKSVIPYLYFISFLRLLSCHAKNIENHVTCLLTKQKTLPKEFKRWFTLVSEVNPLLAFSELKTLVFQRFMLWGRRYMFLPSISKLVKNHLSSELFVYLMWSCCKS